MTLAAIAIDSDAADDVLSRFRHGHGLTGELKGSRIDLTERAALYDLLATVKWHAIVGVAISALQPGAGEDRGDHDIATYARLLEDSITAMVPDTATCANVVIDDGRYGPQTLSHIRDAIAAMIGPCGMAQLELSERSAGLQLADVIANTFFNRALPNDRQGAMGAIVAPLLESGQIVMRVLPGDAPTP
jgi:hypothetical protein